MAAMQIGRLTVLKATDERRGEHTVWRCRCDCGKEALVLSPQLTQGCKKSCGCLQREVHKETLQLIDGTSVKPLVSHRNTLLPSNKSGWTGVYQTDTFNGIYQLQI